MIKKNLIKILMILIFLSSCGYSPIFSKKNSSFSINKMIISGDKTINKIINSKLNNYKNLEGKNLFSLNINSISIKSISSKDSKGNPKTYRINISSQVLVENSNGKKTEKIFSKSFNYKNDDDKSGLKKYENKTTKNLAEKISIEIINFLQSI